MNIHARARPPEKREIGVLRGSSAVTRGVGHPSINQNMATTPTEAFEPLRPRLFGLAYRMLGSRAEAEDILQEAYLRWHQTDRQAIDNHEAWLVTTTSRLAIDRLRRLKTERQAYVGPWLPEAIVSPAPRPIFGADQIVHVLLGLREKFWAVDRVVEIATVNGEPELWIHDGGRPVA